jgi:hypothetical protein
METTTRRDAYMTDVLDVCGPTAVRLVAERIVAEVGATCDLAEARGTAACIVIDCEIKHLARESDYWDGVTTDEAHEIRASIIRDVAAELVRIASAAADEAYEARMSCRRRTRDCGCRTCGG